MFSKYKSLIIWFLIPVMMTIFLFLTRPEVDILSPYELSRLVYDRDGNILRMTMTDDDAYRLRVTATEMSPLVREAILFQEDRFYYWHSGVNPFALFRALDESYIKKSRFMGASTITMQLARMHYDLDSTNIGGKIHQIFRALYLEIYYSKEQILQAYLSLVPCGRNIEGFASGSIYYFGKPLEKLELPEVLLLSVIPQSPADRTPNPDEFNGELNDARMRLYERWLTRHREDENYRQSLLLPPYFISANDYKAPHFTADLIASFPGEERIYSTLHSEIQNILEEQSELYVRRNRPNGVYNASAMILDRNSMEVVASMGSVDFFNNEIEGQVNGTKARRSPGSTLKPFIYALAIDQGLIHSETMLKDAPTSFSEYTPDNFRSDFKGAISAKEALTSSRNVPAVSLASQLEENTLYTLLNKSNVPLKEEKHYGLSIVLGSAELSMEELLTLYGALGNEGRLKPLRKSINSERSYGKELFSREAAYLVHQMLLTNPAPDGYNSKSENIAYKTGTSIGFRDCWAIGLFDEYVIAVWIGNFDGVGNHSFLGRYMAAPLLFELIDAIRSNNLSKGDIPEYENLNLVETAVCSVSGMLKSEYCYDSKITQFIPGISSIEKCRIHRPVYIDPETGFRVNTEGKGTIEEVWEFWPSDLLELFKNAGFPRRSPPPYAPEGYISGEYSHEGYVPSIESPLSNVEYIFRIDSEAFRKIPLKAIVDGDVKRMYWFDGRQYLGSAQPGEILFWEPVPGEHNIRIVDDKGRSSLRRITVGSGQ